MLGWAENIRNVCINDSSGVIINMKVCGQRDFSAI